MGDTAAVQALVARVLADHGRIDGVIHGAGVIEDRKITDKTPESWQRVVAPKVLGTLALAAALDAAPPAFLALFASVAGRYGNSGQTDYAVANEAMNRLAAQLNARWPGCRAVAVNWGPWEGTRHGAGMVSDAVRLKFEAQGVTLVPAEGGAEQFHAEILQGPLEATEVVIGSGPWERHESDRGAVAVAPAATVAAGANGWPLLTDLTQGAAARGGTKLSRRLAVETDPWLGEHRIGGTPVLPMACAAELAAEAAAEIWPDWHVAALTDLRALAGIRLEGGEPKDLDLVAFGAEHADVRGFSARVEIRSTDKLARSHYRASIAMVPPGTPTADEAALALAEEVLAHRPRPTGLTAWRAYRDLLFHGPAYQLAKAIEGLDANGIAIACTGSRAVDFGGAGWLFDPGLLDTAAQLAWVWSADQRGAPALPNAIGRATRLASGQAARMVFRLRPGIVAPQVLADVAVADAAGRPLLLIEGLESTSDAGLARFSGWEGEILPDIPAPAADKAAE
jgi:hypothetical protein